MFSTLLSIALATQSAIALPPQEPIYPPPNWIDVPIEDTASVMSDPPCIKIDCIRMREVDVHDLLDRVKVDTAVVVVK